MGRMNEGVSMISWAVGKAVVLRVNEDWEALRCVPFREEMLTRWLDG
jgi:hypothetical protein